MTRTLPFRFLAASIAAAALSACGTSGQPLASAPQAASGAGYRVQATPTQTEMMVLGQMPFLANTQLTAAQVTRISAILSRGTASAAPNTADEAKAKAILTAPVVDKTALRALLLTALTRQQAEAVKAAATLASVRAVLSESQRAIAAKAVLQNRTASSAPSAPELPPGLTAAQKALFLAAAPKSISPIAGANALAALLTTGDVTAYNAVTAPKRSLAEQAQLSAAALASLTLTQRQAMFTQQSQPGGQGAPPQE